MDWITAYLPKDPLPQWIAVISIVSIASGIRALTNPIQYSQRLYLTHYNKNELSGRLFGVWNLTSAMIRLTCVFNMTNPSVYALTMGSFVIALVHFSSELFIFKTLRLNLYSIPPFVVASTSIAWMWINRQIYVPSLFFNLI